MISVSFYAWVCYKLILNANVGVLNNMCGTDSPSGWSLSRCYVDQQIGPTLSSCNRRRSSELRQSWATVVELGWNNSRTRVGVAELSAGRVAWARDAEAMSS